MWSLGSQNVGLCLPGRPIIAIHFTMFSSVKSSFNMLFHEQICFSMYASLSVGWDFLLETGQYGMVKHSTRFASDLSCVGASHRRMDFWLAFCRTTTWCVPARKQLRGLDRFWQVLRFCQWDPRKGVPGVVGCFTYFTLFKL